MSVRAARGRNPGGAEHFTANYLCHVTAILDRVVEMDFVQAVKLLAVVEFVEVQREGREIFQSAKASGSSFQMNSHVFINGVSLSHGRANIGPVVLAETI